MLPSFTSDLVSLLNLFRDLLDEYGVRLNVIGRTSLLPVNVQEAVHKAEGLSRHNNRCVDVHPFNLCV